MLFFKKFKKTVRIIKNYALCLDDNLVKEATDRLLLALNHICIQENINIQYFDNIYELNNIDSQKLSNLTSSGSLNDQSLAVGKYVHLRDMDLKEQHEYGYPKIQLINNDKYLTWIFAHELGHHFALKFQNDNSEKAADNYIATLCEKHLSEIDQDILRVYIKFYKEK